MKILASFILSILGGSLGQKTDKTGTKRTSVSKEGAALSRNFVQKITVSGGNTQARHLKHRAYPPKRGTAAAAAARNGNADSSESYQGNRTKSYRGSEGVKRGRAIVVQKNKRLRVIQDRIKNHRSQQKSTSNITLVSRQESLTDADNILLTVPLVINDPVDGWYSSRYAPWHLGVTSSTETDMRQFYPYGKEYYYPVPNFAVVAYVLDSGVDRTVDELEGRVLNGANFVVDEDATDYVGHGTAVACVLVGLNNGVAKTSYVVPVKVLNQLNAGSVSGFISAFQWVIQDKETRFPNNPAIINFSINIQGNSRFLNDAIGAVFDSGILTVVSAGNYAGNACDYSPADSPNTISVSAISETNFQFASEFANFGSCVDILAPGQNIFSSVAGTEYGVALFEGTSLSAPIVTGIGAAILSRNPNLTPDELKARILSQGRPDVIQALPEDTPNLLAFNGYPGDTSLMVFQ